MGVGVKAHLEQTYDPFPTHQEAIAYALRPNVSGTFRQQSQPYAVQNNAGLGLTYPSQMLKRLKGDMYIVSHDGLVHVSPEDVTTRQWWSADQRHSKTLGRFATKTSAWNAAQVFRAKLPQTQQTGAPTVAALVEQYRSKKMPARLDTHRGYESWIRVHILPKWGQKSITDLQARPVEVWLGSLTLSPKSRVHIRGILSSLWKFAMWKQDIPLQVNPMSLVAVKDASKRIRQRISSQRTIWNDGRGVRLLRPSHL